MGKLKDRTKQHKTKDYKMSMRINSVLLDELKNKTKNNNNTKAIEEAIKEYLASKRNNNTNYVCYNCGKTILKQEMYYCNLDQLEIRMNNEIIVTKGEPTKILCMKCAKKDKKILKFIESEDEEKEDLVGETKRTE